jgi:hypothetical protein
MTQNLPVVTQEESENTIYVDGNISRSFSPKVTSQNVSTHLDTNWIVNGCGGFERNQDIPEREYPIRRVITYWKHHTTVSYYFVRGGGYPPSLMYEQVGDDADLAKWAYFTKYFKYGEGDESWVNNLRHGFTNYHLWQDTGILSYRDSYIKAMDFIAEGLPQLAEVCNKLKANKLKVLAI